MKHLSALDPGRLLDFPTAGGAQQMKVTDMTQHSEMTRISGFPGTPPASTWIGAVRTISSQMLRSSTRHAIQVVAAIALVGMTAGAQAQTEQKPEAIAEQAYIYGLQQAIYYGQRWTYTQNDAKDNIVYAGLNQFSWVRKQITPDYPVVTPNATTLYGAGFLDLRAGPVVIEVPEITDRYFSVQVMDQYGIFRMIVGSPFNGTRARKYILVPPGFTGNVPADFPTTEIVQWPSLTAYGVVRMAVETGSEAEIKKINGYQDQVTITPLADWLANGHKGIAQADRKIVKGDFLIPDGLPEYQFGQVDKADCRAVFHPAQRNPERSDHANVDGFDQGGRHAQAT